MGSRHSLLSWFMTRQARPRQRRRTRQLQVEPLELRAMLTTFFVDGTLGNDTLGDGSDANPFATIQRGIDEADDAVTPGADTVFVRAGTYVENPVINDADPLTLRGEEGVVVDGGSKAFPVRVIDSQDTELTLRNLTITNGWEGIVADGGSLTVDQVDVTDIGDEGILGENLATVDISNSSMTDNDPADDGIDLRNVGDVTLTRVTAERNDGDGLYVFNANSLTIVGGSFSDNADYGINLDGVIAGAVVLQNVTADRNGDDDGLHVDVADSVTIIGGSYSDNDREGIDLDNVGTVVIRNVTANGNQNGAGLDVDLSASVEISGGNFSRNSGNGLFFRAVGSLSLTNVKAMRNTLHGLRAGQAGAGGPAGAVGDLTIVGGQFSRNGRDGLLIEATGDVLLTRVRGIGNGDDGLEVFGTPLSVVLDKVFFKNNFDEDIVV